MTTDCPASTILPVRRQLEFRVSNPQSPSVSTKKSPHAVGPCLRVEAGTQQ